MRHKTLVSQFWIRKHNGSIKNRILDLLSLCNCIKNIFFISTGVNHISCGVRYVWSFFLYLMWEVMLIHRRSHQSGFWHCRWCPWWRSWHCRRMHTGVRVVSMIAGVIETWRSYWCWLWMHHLMLINALLMTVLLMIVIRKRGPRSFRSCCITCLIQNMLEVHDVVNSLV